MADDVPDRGAANQGKMMRSTLLVVFGITLGGLAAAQAIQSPAQRVATAGMTSNEAMGIGAVEEVGRVHPDGRVHVEPLATPGTTIIDLVSGRRHAQATVSIVREAVGLSRAKLGGGTTTAEDPPHYLITDLAVRVDGCAIDFPILESQLFGDPHGIALGRSKGGWTLTLRGADTDEGYTVAYRFDDNAVVARTIAWGVSDDETATFHRTVDRDVSPRDCVPDRGPRHPAEALRPDAVLAANH